MNRNLTVSIDEKSYRSAKVAAARRGQSVSMLIREYFASLEGEFSQAPVSVSSSSQSLLESLGDERLADLDLDLPRFSEGVKVPDLQ